MSQQNLVNVRSDFYSKIKRFIANKVENKDDREDLLQEIFTKLLHSNPVLEEGNALSWLHTVARNTIIDYYRRLKRHANHLDITEIDLPEILPEKNEVAACLEPLINQLSKEDSDILKAVELDEEPLLAYATKQSLNYAAAKSRIHRARKRLQNKLMACCQFEYDTSNVPMEIKKTVR